MPRQRRFSFGDHAKSEALKRGGWVVRFYLAAMRPGIKRKAYHDYLVQACSAYKELAEGFDSLEIEDLHEGLTQLAKEMGVKNPKDMIDTLKGGMKAERISRNTGTLKELIEKTSREDPRLDATKVEGEEHTYGAETSNRLKAIRGKVSNEEIDSQLGNHFLNQE